MKIGIGDTNRNVVNNKIGIGGAWRTGKEIKIGVAGAWRSVWKRVVEFILTFTSKADFDGCTRTNVVTTAGGDVELSTVTPGVYNLQGSIESPAIDISPAVELVNSNIAFNSTINTGRHLSFDGVDDYVMTASLGGTPISDPSVSGALTVECWAYIEGGFYLLSSGGQAGNSKGFCMSYHNGAPLFNIHDGAKNWAVSLDAGIMVANEWAHWAMVWNGTVLNIYKNGNLVESANSTGDLVTIDNYTTLTFGRPNNVETAFFKGCLDDVRIWSTARTQEEIKANMGKELIGNETGLIGYWDCNETEGDTVYDKTANGYNGTSSGIVREVSPSNHPVLQSTVIVQTALSTDGGTNWDDWQTATSGAAIPGLTAGDDVSNTRMKWKATLSTNDAAVTPKLHEVAVKLNEGI